MDAEVHGSKASGWRDDRPRIPPPSLAINRMFLSTESFGWSENGRRRMPQPVMVPDCVRGFLIAAIRGLMSGLIQPIAQRPMKTSWESRVLSRRVIVKSHISSPYSGISSGPTQESRWSDLALSMFCRSKITNGTIHLDSGHHWAPMRIGLVNIVYDTCRFIFLERMGASA